MTRDPGPGRRGETGPAACRLLLLPASEFWPKLKTVWQWPSFPIHQVHHRRLLAQAAQRSGAVSNYPNMQQLPACVESVCSAAVLQIVRCWLHDAEDHVTESGFWFWLSPGAGCSVVECGGWCCTKLEIQRSPSTPSLCGANKRFLVRRCCSQCNFRYCILLLFSGCSQNNGLLGNPIRYLAKAAAANTGHAWTISKLEHGGRQHCTSSALSF